MALSSAGIVADKTTYEAADLDRKTAGSHRRDLLFPLFAAQAIAVTAPKTMMMTEVMAIKPVSSHLT